MSFFAELRRRNVFRVGIAYALMGWVVLQFADFALDLIDAPNWVIQSLTIIVAIGLPFVLFFSWAYEMTPEGLKRDADVDRSRPEAGRAARKLDRFIIILLVVALGYFFWESRLAGPPGPGAAVPPKGAPTPNGATPATGGHSIAILPFMNMSADPEKEYFSDGITEEIINAVVKIPGISVPARTSVFGFKGHQGDIRAVGVELGVDHVLEGSVRSQGDQVRVTAQLIKVDDGFHLWSETYDRKLENIFVVQDEIAGAIAEVVVGELGVQAVPNRTENMAAYDLYLQGRTLFRNRDRDAVNVLTRAAEADPAFAPAWAALAQAWQIEGYYDQDIGTQERAEEFARRALAIDPDNVDALNALASVLRDTWRWAEAEAVFRRALAIDPQSSELLEDWAEFLVAVARFDEMLEVTTAAYALDQRLQPLSDAHIQALTLAGRYEDGLAVIDAYDVQDINTYYGPLWKAPTLLAKDDLAAIVALIEAAPDGSIPAELRDAYLVLLDDPENEAARLQVRAYFSADNDSIVQNRGWFSKHFLAWSGEVEYTLDTLAQLYGRVGWGNVEEIWDPSIRDIRVQPGFADLLETLNLPGYWDQVGWPDVCRRDDAGGIVCK